MKKQSMVSVIGSYAVGMTISSPHFPVGGETVMGKNFSMLHGGKGSNQAVVCSRMGANVLYGTCIGQDSFGDMCVELDKQEKIDARYVRRSVTGLSTGVGLVIVNSDGENEIVIDFGANNEFSPVDVEAMLPDIENTGILLMQLEMSIETTVYAAKRCAEKGIKFVLNPAPYQALPSELLKHCEYLTPNQTEARQILGLSSSDTTPDEEIAKRLHALGVKNVVMTLGGEGAMIVNDHMVKHVPGIVVEAVDTTGAGDTFTGALCVALAQGKDIVSAVCMANVAAGLACTAFGVIESIPQLSRVEAYMKAL